MTYDSDEMMVCHHLKPVLGHISLKELRPDQVQRFYNTKRDADLLPRTIRLMHTLLHGVLKEALKNQVVTRNVSEATTRPSVKARKMRPLTLEQTRQFLTAIKEDRWFPSICLEPGTGLRRVELWALCWCHLDLEAGTLHVRQELVRVRNHDASEGQGKTRLAILEPKTEHARRTIPLPAETVEVLKRYNVQQAQEKLLFGETYEDHGLIFCQPNGRFIDPRSFTRYFDRLLKQAGLSHIRFHDGRHTFATLLLELGESPKTVQTMLGHSRITTNMDIYSQASLNLAKRAAAKLNETLQG